MSLTPEDRKWHDAYDTAPRDLKDRVDEAYGAAVARMREEFLKTANDDRAEALIAAITRYVIECENHIEDFYP